MVAHPHRLKTAFRHQNYTPRALTSFLEQGRARKPMARITGLWPLTSSYWLKATGAGR
jgi:hypothetical protein